MLRQILSILLLILTFPLYVLCSLTIWLEDGSPVLFKQKRVGVNYTFFQMYKFRTMRKDTPNIATHLLENPEKFVLKSGRLLRRYSLDELPNLFNILKGEMNFIGPRPALYNQDDLMQLRIQAGIHVLKPGITGWAQVNGRDELSLTEKVKFEAEYLSKKSFRFDLYILLITLRQAISGKGITH